MRGKPIRGTVLAATPAPDYGAEPVIGRRVAPTRWRLHPG
jgi:hypothetical protein